MYFKKEKYYHFVIEEENKEKALQRAFEDEFYLLKNNDKYTKYTKYRRDCIIIEIINEKFEYYNIGIYYKSYSEINKYFLLYKKIDNISEVFDFLTIENEKSKNKEKGVKKNGKRKAIKRRASKIR